MVVSMGGLNSINPSINQSVVEMIVYQRAPQMRRHQDNQSINTVSLETPAT